jgi:hypothetical protein
VAERHVKVKMLSRALRLVGRFGPLAIGWNFLTKSSMQNGLMSMSDGQSKLVRTSRQLPAELKVKRHSCTIRNGGSLFSLLDLSASCLPAAVSH